MERRLSAILAADMVGYSRLIEADEVGTLERQKAHRKALIDPALSEFNGRIVKEMGDGILVEFPSVVDAVQCAVQIQRAMPERQGDVAEDQRIAYRIGINLGDIVAEGDDIYGDGVNVAARLEQLAETGGICISGTAYDHMRSTVDVGYESLGEVRVKNIERPIRAYKILIKPGHAAVSSRHRPGKSTVRKAAVVALIALAIIAGGAWWAAILNSEPPNVEKTALKTGEKPSIAVLPFDNISDDAEQQYFVDGMTDDLITDLSKISSLFVIARDSTFAYKGQNLEPGQIARDLGVRYVLNGSVRASGERVRINSRLVDTQTGGQIWADRFDRKIEDIFSLQDDVTSQIVSALAIKLTPEEEGRLDHSEKETTPEVYDLYLRGIEGLRQFTQESLLDARTYFLKALAIDPDYARAHAAIAFTYTANSTFFREQDIEEALDESIRYAQRALELDPTLPQGHFAMAVTLLRRAQHDEALDAARKAVRYDPNYADGYVVLANVLMFSGNAQDALSAMGKAMELNPRYSAAYLDILGRAYFVAENYEEAIAQLEQCLARDPTSVGCHSFLTVAYAMNGRREDAEWEAEELALLAPGISIGNNNISYQFKQDVLRERFDKGLRLAGIPE